jgi:signal transduction histidine kinase
MSANSSIKRKVFLTVILLCLTSITILVFFAYWYQMHQLRARLEDQAGRQLYLFNSIIASDAEGLARTHLGLDRIDALLKPFAARDKEALRAAAQPIFNESRRNYGITHMYFIEPDGKVLLRVHKPEQAGDVLNRATFLKAQATQRIVSGLELGENFFSLRCVGPVSLRGRQIGYIEVAEEIDHIFTQMKSITGYEVSLFVRDDYLGRHHLPVRAQNVAGGFTLLYPTQKEVALGLAAQLETEMQGALLTPKLILVNYNGGKYVVGMGPVRDAAGVTAGILFSHSEITPFFSTLWGGVAAYSGILIAILLSSLFLLYLSLRKSLALFWELKGHIASVTTTWDLSKRINVQTHDEMGELAHDFNSMAEKLRVLSVELEQRVAERTTDLLRLNRLYAVLTATGEAIVRAANRDSLFQEICRVAIEHGGLRMAWIGVVDEESETILPVASSGIVDGYLDNLVVSTREIAEGLGPTGTAFREERLVSIPDVLDDPDFAMWRREAEKRGYRAGVAMPLRLHGKPAAVLTMYSSEQNFFDPQLCDLLLRMGEDISFALDNFDRESRRMAAEQALREEMLERMQVTEALREKEKFLILQSRQAAMGEMVNNVAHQWRQPLNSLNLNVQELMYFYDRGLFSREFLADNVKKSLELVKHMSQTIEDFRGFFRPEREVKPFHVAEVIRKTLFLISDSLKVRNVQVDFIAEEDVMVTGFPNEFSQVLLNILNNARDALIERGVETPRIVIRTSRQDGGALITISDNAGGIPESIIDKIFDPYFTTKDDQSGTGIGLYISKTIIEERMKGKLSVLNTAEGAEFRIEVG